MEFTPPARKRSSSGTRATSESTSGVAKNGGVPNGKMTPALARVARIQLFLIGVYHVPPTWYLWKLLVPDKGPPAISATSRVVEPWVGVNGLSRLSRSKLSDRRCVV